MHKAVLDTNVLVSGVIARRGIPGQLLGAWRRRDWELLIAPRMLDDLQRVLARPKIARSYGLTREDIADILRLLEQRATVVRGRLVIPRVSRDPEDDHVLACAVEGDADYIVTGDHDLLALGRYRSIPIVTPARFAAILSATR